ncbi:MAG: TetR family transcriptional regulator [Aquisalimonadaceae bacterium]
MARRRKEEAQETRERILDAAIAVFHESGVARPSLTEVAELAGVTRGAVYGHFRNKADLFTALADRVRLPAEMFSETDVGECRRDPLGELRARWVYLFREVTRNPQWRQILQIIFHRCERMTESVEIRDRLLQGHAEGGERIARLLRQAVAAGDLPADLDVDAAKPLLYGSLVGVLENWLLRPDAYDFAAAGERYVDSLFDVLRHSPALRRRPAVGAAGG